MTSHYKTRRFLDLRLPSSQLIATNAALIHRPDTLPVVMYLLNIIADEYQHTTPHGSYVHPGTILRCGGIQNSESSRPDLTATFISFPYFDISSTCESLRKLFQQFYPEGPTPDMDDNEQFRQSKTVQPSHFLCVPQL